MTATAKTSLRMAIYSALGAASGNAVYGWWRHGAVDWVGVLEFALGWGVAALALQGIGRWWQERKRRQAGSLVSQE